MAPSPSELALREKSPFNFAVVDEATKKTNASRAAKLSKALQYVAFFFLALPGGLHPH